MFLSSDGQAELTPNRKTHLNWTNWTIGGRIGRGGDDVGCSRPPGATTDRRRTGGLGKIFGASRRKFLLVFFFWLDGRCQRLTKSLG